MLYWARQTEVGVWWGGGGGGGGGSTKTRDGTERNGMNGTNRTVVFRR